jgi:hypothetical protein
MTTRQNVILVFLSLSVLVVVAAFQPQPGYMDADYYYVTGLEIFSGGGFQENFIWNYLAEPDGLPVPSHRYWMPLTSILAALGMRILGSSFFAARIFLVAVAAVIPVLTGPLTFLISQNAKLAFIAGFLAVFSGYYLVFMPITDAFGLYMLLGSLLLLIVHKRTTDPSWFDPLLLGLLVGLLHLARADGLLWVPVGFWVLYQTRAQSDRPFVNLFQSLGLFMVGYLFFMAPWYLRNFVQTGAFFAPGGSKVLWLTDYDELFAFPAGMLTFERWIQSGIFEILKVRLWAAGQNLQTLLAVQGGIFLLPLIVAGAWIHRKSLVVQTALLYWITLWLVMTLVLPFPGVRGSFFHSGSATQPLFWALVPIGLDFFITRGQKTRGWNPAQARPVFSVGILSIMAVLTILLTARSLGFSEDRTWGLTNSQYQAVGIYVDSTAYDNRRPVMVNNPPGYNLSTEQPAIVIPGGPIESARAAAVKYGAAYLVLEPDKNFQTIYTGEKTVNWLIPVNEIDTLKIYQIDLYAEPTP